MTYGGMSREPLPIPTSLLIFKDLQVRGFWMTRWYASCSEEDRQKMMDYLLGLAREGRFKEPLHEKVELIGEPNKAEKSILQSIGKSTKQILVFP